MEKANAEMSQPIGPIEFMETKQTPPPDGLAPTAGSPLWTTGEIVSAGTGRLCCPMERVYAIMNHLTGQNLYTHQLPKAFKDCQQWVLKQHPWLATLDESECTSKTWEKWLAEAEKKAGATQHQLDPMPGGVEQRDPVEELQEIMGRKRVIVI